MADIHVDLDKMQQAVTYLSSKAYIVSTARRTVGLLRWKIPEDIRTQHNIENRLEEVTNQLLRAEQLMQEMKTVMNSCMTQYKTMENKLNENAKNFLE